MKLTNKNLQKAAGYQLASANERVKAANERVKAAKTELHAAQCQQKSAGYMLAASTTSTKKK